MAFLTSERKLRWFQLGIGSAGGAIALFLGHLLYTVIGVEGLSWTWSTVTLLTSMIVSVIGGATAAAYLLGALFKRNADRDRAEAHQIKFEVLSRDLEITAAVQGLLLPQNSTARYGDLMIESFYRPAHKAGGDWWWHEGFPDNRALILIGDVSGHGAGAAMVTALVTGCLQAFRRSEKDWGSETSIAKFLGCLDNTIRDLCRDRYLMTFSAVLMDSGQNLITVWNAGAPYSCLQDLEKGGLPQSFVTTPSPPLGSTHPGWVKNSYPFPRGSRVFLYTDGAYEFALANGKSYGRRKLFRTISSMNSMSAASACHAWNTKIEELRQEGALFDDDMSLVVIDRLKAA